MFQFVIILSTVIRSPFDLGRIKNTIANFTCISEWSHDLDDADKILRIVADKDISKILLSDLQSVGVDALLLQVFKNKDAV